MDNRIDQTEDQQATAGHPAGRIPGMPIQPIPSGLTAGPHNDPPPSHGVIDTSKTWQADAANDAASNESSLGARRWSRLNAFTHVVSANAVPLLLGGGLAALLLTLRGARRH